MEINAKELTHLLHGEIDRSEYIIDKGVPGYYDDEIYAKLTFGNVTLWLQWEGNQDFILHHANSHRYHDDTIYTVDEILDIVL